MEQLNEQLTIASATIEEWTHRRTKKDGLKVNFTVSAPLPKLLAEQLRCGGIYADDTNRIDLSHKLKDVELIVPVPGVEDAFASFFPDVLYAFKAKRDEQQFTIEFACHVTVRAEELHEIFKGSPDVFDIEIRPRQGQLFDGGTRVELSNSELLSRAVKEMTPEQQKLADEILAGADRDFGCVACNNGIPMADGIPGRHASGADCTRPAESPDAAPLASAAVMGVGTHQAKRKPRADKSTVN